MSYINWKFIRTPFVDNKYTANTTEITGFYQPKVRVKLGDSKDSFDFKINNFNNESDNLYRPRDKITIYRTVNSTTADTSDILMVGAIKGVPNSVDTNDNMIRIEGYNFSEAVLNALVFSDARNKTIPEALEQAITEIQNYGTEFMVTWDETNPTEKKDGSDFPEVKEKWFYKPMRKIIEDYSSDGHTEDGRYYWYVNRENKLVWQPENDEVIYTYNSLTDTDTKTINISKDTSDVVNLVIIKGGLDPKGAPITARYQDFTSSNKHGVRYKFITEYNKFSSTQNRDDMIRAIQVSGAPTSNDYGTLPGNVPGFTYPFRFEWMAVGEDAEDDGDYTEKFRAYIKTELKKKGKSYIDNYALGKLKVDIEITAGSKNWGLGDIIDCFIPNTSLDSIDTTKKLRINEIQYATDSDIYSLIEDEGTI